MKVFAVFVIVAIFAFASVKCMPEPAYDGPTYELTRIEDVDTSGGIADHTEEAPIRHRRVTCDLFSFQSKWLTPNHTACAAKCIAQRRRGGRCSNGVCVCR
ncbi:defensin-2 [Cephus cinctus]|uniref:Defensin-2 n=1 Tax=Cephus cinctus TaxID=211228 RepID=A0AAJ7FNI4_CEPCN|nr:defensin-2 [Cephus cinctus]